jgi:hypothetical protein
MIINFLLKLFLDLQQLHVFEQIEIKISGKSVAKYNVMAFCNSRKYGRKCISTNTRAS